MGEVLLLHISHNDKELYEKMVDLLTESGYQINHLHNKENQTELLQFKELEIIPERPIYILTVWGVGYKFNGEI